MITARRNLCLLLLTVFATSLTSNGAPPAVFTVRHNWADGGAAYGAKTDRNPPFADVATPLAPEAAARMVADRSLQRIYRTGTRAVPGTRFTMGLNLTGWCVQIECAEPDAGILREKAPYGGELVEIFFAPSAQGPVYHLVADLAARNLKEMRLLESGSGPRALSTGAWLCGDGAAGRFLKSSIAVLKEEWRIAFEVPFTILGATSPVERLEPWRFNVIRWLPGSEVGAVTWRGEPGDPAGWGEIQWLPPEDLRKIDIRRSYVENVWKRYRLDTVEAMIQWSGRRIDPDFYTVNLLPIITNISDCVTTEGNKTVLVSLAPRKEKPGDPEMEMELEDPVKEASRLIDKLYVRTPAWIDFPQQCDRLRRDLLLERLCGPAAAAVGTPARYFAVPPFSAMPRLPGSPPEDGLQTPSIRIVATPGEFEAASFVIVAAGDVSRLEFQPGALTDGGRTLPAGQIDLRVVKCWFQGATAWQSGAGGGSGRALIPELLLKDDSLVQADMERKTNLLRTDKGMLDLSTAPAEGPRELPVRDAATLQPVKLRRGESRQFWLTIKVPDNQPPGLYRGEIAVRADGRGWPSLQLAVRVLPFSLPSPGGYMTTGSVYLTALGGGGLPAGSGTPAARARSDAQMMAELRNRREHNDLHPLVADPACSAADFRKLMELRRGAGLALRPVLGLGYACPEKTGDASGAAKFAETVVQPLLRLVREVCGHGELYLMGRDASGEELTRQRPYWEAALDTGAHIMTRGWDEHFSAMGYLVDLHARYGVPSRMRAFQWHRSGGQVAQCGDPAGALENPERSRRHFGLLPYQAGCDGVIGESYWDERPWEEFDPRRNRPRNIVYPTLDGVIDTLAWEGFREGLDDVRYATLLRRLAEGILDNSRAPAFDRAREALHLLELMDARTADLDTLRLELATALVDLHALGLSAPASTSAAQ